MQAKRPPQISQPTLLAATAFTGVIIILLFLFAIVGEHKLIHLQPVDYGVFVYLGIFNSVISYLCWNSALARIGNIKTSIIYYLLPQISSIGSFLLVSLKPQTAPKEKSAK